MKLLNTIIVSALVLFAIWFMFSAIKPQAPTRSIQMPDGYYDTLDEW